MSIFTCLIYAAQVIKLDNTRQKKKFYSFSNMSCPDSSGCNIDEVNKINAPNPFGLCSPYGAEVGISNPRD